MPRSIDEIVNGLAGPQLAPQEASTPAYHPRAQPSANVEHAPPVTELDMYRNALMEVLAELGDNMHWNSRQARRDRTYSQSRDPNSGSASGMWKHPVPSVE
jgi:hypothetical protein